MTLTQLLITGGALVGIIVIGLLAMIPSLLDYPPRLGRKNPPLGRDQDDPICRHRPPPTIIAVGTTITTWRPERSPLRKSQPGSFTRLTKSPGEGRAPCPSGCSERSR